MNRPPDLICYYEALGTRGKEFFEQLLIDVEKSDHITVSDVNRTLCQGSYCAVQIMDGYITTKTMIYAGWLRDDEHKDFGFKLSDLKIEIPVTKKDVEELSDWVKLRSL